MLAGVAGRRAARASIARMTLDNCRNKPMVWMRANPAVQVSATNGGEAAIERLASAADGPCRVRLNVRMVTDDRLPILEA